MASSRVTEQRIDELRASVDRSRQFMEEYRNRRLELLRQYVGYHYSTKGSADKRPLPLMNMAVTIYLQFLAGVNPRVLVKTPARELRPDARDLEDGLNLWLEMTDFEGFLRRWVMDALFGMAVAKTGLEGGHVVELDGRLVETGQPFCDNIDPDDLVFDPDARRWDEADWIGNYYTLPTSQIRDCDLYNARARKRIEPGERDMLQGSVERTESLGRDEQSDEHYREKTRLLDVWLRSENLIVTLNADGDWNPPLRVTEWTGPPHGMYHRLGFDDVPQNVMPMSPLAGMYDLDDLANRLWNKVGRQAERAKTVGVVQGGNEEDARRLMQAGDGEVTTTSGGLPFQEMKTGGVDQPTAAFAMMLKDLFTYFGGNLDMLGGLSPQSATLGQDRLLSEAASKRMEGMQKKVLRAVKRVVTDIAQYLYTDPLISLPITRKVPGGSGDTYSFDWGPQHRTADFFKFNFSVDPYSMEYQTPTAQLARLTQVVSQYIVPLMPLLSQQQIGINAEALLKRVSRLANMDGLDEILIYGAGENEPARGPMEPRSMKSPVTHRVNERVNRPGASTAQKDQMLVNMLMGGRAQPKEEATMMRGVG